MDLAGHEGQPLGPHATAVTADTMPLHPQPHGPCPPGQVPDPPFRPAVDRSHRDPAPPTDVVWLPGRLPDRATATSTTTGHCLSCFWGASGQLQGNRHVVTPPQTPMSNLLVSMLDKVGVHKESFGDSTGRVEI